MMDSIISRRGPGGLGATLVAAPAFVRNPNTPQASSSEQLNIPMSPDAAEAPAPAS